MGSQHIALHNYKFSLLNQQLRDNLSKKKSKIVKVCVVCILHISYMLYILYNLTNIFCFTETKVKVLLGRGSRSLDRTNFLTLCVCPGLCGQRCWLFFHLPLCLFLTGWASWDIKGGACCPCTGHLPLGKTGSHPTTWNVARHTLIQSTVQYNNQFCFIVSYLSILKGKNLKLWIYV